MTDFSNGEARAALALNPIRLHFTRTGSMLIATRRNVTFVVHELPNESVAAKVFRRTRPTPIDTKYCTTTAQAIDWLAKHREAS